MQNNQSEEHAEQSEESMLDIPAPLDTEAGETVHAMIDGIARMGTVFWHRNGAHQGGPLDVYDLHRRLQLDDPHKLNISLITQ